MSLEVLFEENYGAIITIIAGNSDKNLARVIQFYF